MTMIAEKATPTRSAEKATPTRAAEKAAPKKKPFLKSKKGIMIILAVLLVGGGAYKFLMPTKVAPPSGGDVVKLDATTLNLAGGHYLQIAVTVQLVKGKPAAADLPSHAAELVIDEFSDRPVATLSSNAGRQKLAADLEKKLKTAYPGEVFDLFLTQYVTK